MTLDTPDALVFDQTVTRIAGDLRDLGDIDNLDTRRAKAVGVLADPQFALDLMSGRDNPRPAVRVSARVHWICSCTSPPTDLAPPGTGAEATVGRHGAMSHPTPGRLAHPAHRSRRQDHRPPGPRPRMGSDRGRPARPTRCDARAWLPARQRTACSPAVDATPEAATSTTSPPTSP